jgi:hypothetical protein
MLLLTSGAEEIFLFSVEEIQSDRLTIKSVVEGTEIWIFMYVLVQLLSAVICVKQR